MPRTKPQVNIRLVLPNGGGDNASHAWVRATEILLRLKARKDGAIIGVESMNLTAELPVLSDGSV